MKVLKTKIAIVNNNKFKQKMLFNKFYPKHQKLTDRLFKKNLNGNKTKNNTNNENHNIVVKKMLCLKNHKKMLKQLSLKSVNKENF